MKRIDIQDGLNGSQIVAGCMRIAEMTDNELDTWLGVCVDNGVDFFDHADRYGNGKCEEVFGAALKRQRGLRERMIIQSKCGIRATDFGIIFDFDAQHIINSVEGSIRRLGVEYLDVLLLHRPDTLVEPEEVAKAFDRLSQKGMVKHFGVSNQSPYLIELLKKYIKQDIRINQLQFSAAASGMVEFGFNVNTKKPGSFNRDGGLLEYSRLHDMTIQAWSPLNFGAIEGIFLGHERYAKLNSVLDRLAQIYGLTPAGIATAFILRHPAKFQVITGTTQPERLKAMCDATKIRLTKEEWYEIYQAGVASS